MAKILFIEDEKFLMEAFIFRLEDEGHVVVVAKNGETAITLLKNGKHDFDLIILDIMLPIGEPTGIATVGRDVKTDEMGFEILRQLRQRMKNKTPVIVLTAAIDVDLKDKVIQLGVKKYFTKPASLENFMGAVNDVLTISKA